MMTFFRVMSFGKGFPGGTSGKEPTYQCRCKRLEFDPRSGRSPGGGHDNPLQYSCLKNPMDRGAWWAIVHGVKKSRTQLKWLGTHSMHIIWKTGISHFDIEPSKSPFTPKLLVGITFSFSRLPLTRIEVTFGSLIENKLLILGQL